MVSRKRSRAIVPLVACLPLLVWFASGCQVAVPLAVTTTSMGVAYYYMNVSDKTAVYDIDTMTRATVSTLKKMGFKVSEQSMDTRGDRKIKAEAEEFNVTVKLKKITKQCTKIKVRVSEDVVMRDRATAAEIVFQTEKTAEQLTGRKQSRGRVSDPGPRYSVDNRGGFGYTGFVIFLTNCSNRYHINFKEVGNGKIRCAL
jgi:hypothetical protein